MSIYKSILCTLNILDRWGYLYMNITSFSLYFPLFLLSGFNENFFFSFFFLKARSGDLILDPHLILIMVG
jgi:hypothetical protein